MRKYAFAILIVTAAVGQIPLAHAEVMQDSAFGRAVILAPEQKEDLSSLSSPWVFSKTNLQKIWNALNPKPAMPKKPARKQWDPFRAARVLMTSA